MDGSSTPSYCVGLSLILAILLTSPHGCKCNILEDVCPEGKPVLNTNRTEGVHPSYDGGDIKHWFTLARDFVNAVKKQNLPYGMCRCR